MYLIQDVQILMNSWMIHVLKLENLNQIFQHHVNNISHFHGCQFLTSTHPQRSFNGASPSCR